MKGDEVKSAINQERMSGESEREQEESQEEDNAEIELSAAKYLALLRETEIMLYRATRSHEKVK